ncbi:Crp/Fnr family transcriptional regulator [Methylobacterium terricola]|uniref:Crp/Fnr family transcriptional regulator n=1 Tax=Methylobacterium terricola TaxID=2583531 RepID=A0A5C4L5Y5_9HYPH|nr:Crp/Fnr family transcriptional regulator [Methylobacterium terricola]TNC05295.1 Crp/Fnr family transcriptional regulator [Methylobacterium terricola]
MSQPQQASVRNRLLQVLPPDDFTRLAPHLDAQPIKLREVLIPADEPISHAYFIEEGLCSIIGHTAEGRLEIGTVGYDGFVGTPLVLGTDRTPHVSMVQGEGMALRIPAAALRAAFDESATMRGVLGRYVQSLIVQVGQTVYANAELNIEGRLARWILMIHDRLQKDEMPLTHDFLALILGVRRPGVTTSVHILEGAGMIKAMRGRVRVLDREKMMDLAGDTYGVAEAEYERLLAEA